MQTKRALSGLVAGTCGTIAMGGFAFLSRRMVEPGAPIGKTHYESVVERAASVVSPEVELEAATRIRLGELAHLGFGAFWGMVFALTMGERPISPVARGLSWGTALWAVAFTGYMPSLGISRSLRQMGNYERLRTLGSHVVFATFTWVFLAQMTRGDDR